MEKYGRTRQATDDNIIRGTRIACRILKATHANLEYVTLIAFALKQWFLEHLIVTSIRYIACLVLNVLSISMLLFLTLSFLKFNFNPRNASSTEFNSRSQKLLRRRSVCIGKHKTGGKRCMYL